MKRRILMFTTLIACTCVATAQQQTEAQPKGTIKHIPIKSTSPTSGKDMYTAYCAVCHGTDMAKAEVLPPVRLKFLPPT
jgi:cytochrome c5